MTNFYENKMATWVSLYSIWKFLADSRVTLPPKSNWYTWLVSFHMGDLFRKTSLRRFLTFTGGGALKFRK